MKFSIFSGFYNNLHHFENVWRGIQNQTYDNWEWIISDDFSDDESISKFLEDFSRTHPKVKFIKPRWKREFYFNPPVEAAIGEIMIVQDVDDYPNPKLLEVYKYNFEKFPHVEMISCSSMVRKGSIFGPIEWYKNNHFKDVYNLRQGEEKMWRSLGDARAYRIRTRETEEFVKKDQLKHSFAEDVYKSYQLEMRGKILFLPRILQTYSQGSSSSISHAILPNEELELIAKEDRQQFDLMNQKINLDELDSIEHYYDDCQVVWSGLLFSEHYIHQQNFKFDIHNSSLNPRNRVRIKELYFDHDIIFQEFREDADYAFFKIDCPEDVDYLSKHLEFYFNRGVKITICCEKDELKKMTRDKVNFAHFWHDWSILNFVLNQQF